MRIIKYNLLLQKDDRIPYLVKEDSKNYPQLSNASSPKEAVRIVNEVFHANLQSEEHCYLIAQRGSRVIGVFDVSHGSINEALISPKEVLTRLLLLSASAFIILHNHPSGDSNPSNADKTVTKQLREASDIMSICMFDHIIIGENDTDYYSFLEHNILSETEESS